MGTLSPTKPPARPQSVALVSLVRTLTSQAADQVRHADVAVTSAQIASTLLEKRSAMASPTKAAAPTLPRMFSITEIAEMFGRAPRTIRSWIADGRLQAVKIGHAVFIPQAQIDTLLSTLNTPKYYDSRSSQCAN